MTFSLFPLFMKVWATLRWVFDLDMSWPWASPFSIVLWASSNKAMACGLTPFCAGTAVACATTGCGGGAVGIGLTTMFDGGGGGYCPFMPYGCGAWATWGWYQLCGLCATCG